MAIMMKTMEDDSELDVDSLNHALNESSKALTELEKGEFFKINAVHLYFDLDDDTKWSEKDSTELYENAPLAVYKSKELLEITKDLEPLYKAPEANETMIEFYEEDLKEQVPQYVSALNKFICSMERNRTANYAVVQKI